MRGTFEQALGQLTAAYRALISRPNPVDPAWSNGLFERYRYSVAKTTIEKGVDYALHTPEDGLRSAACVDQRIGMIRKNLTLMGR